ncbi:uncharacterized protein LOC127244962 [Andrographis paniculata]|uniref:uncharacterized protein LOC127244962 n=1 Tax=Andrographis paniculata TaxID=175694 RepID=UPI0021E87892|nr:uncharacterized protein LOC127244962 [Andrographis paniculata]XP_051121537.1 uncharacterized protein LOC127244962 [Andrographis paniculata]
MATPASRMLQDQNLNIATHGGGLGGRKALMDISNSRKPLTNRAVKKDTSTNIFSAGNDTFKPKSTKAPEKRKAGGRKALADLTNSAKPSLGRKANAAAERNIPSCMAEEGFLHNHQECIAARTKPMDVDHFFKLTGLHHDFVPNRAIPVTPKKLDKHSEIEDMLDSEVHGGSPWFQSVKSPKSPPRPYMSFEDDEEFSDLKIIDSPPPKVI